jgi:hypothetical protein
MADFRRMLRQALDALAPFGILQDDSKLDNYHGVGDRIMAVDLERVNEGLTDKILSFHIEFEIDELSERDEATQYCLWNDGLIAIDQ